MLPFLFLSFFSSEPFIVSIWSMARERALRWWRGEAQAEAPAPGGCIGAPERPLVQPGLGRGSAQARGGAPSS